MSAGLSSIGGVLQIPYTTIRSCLEFCLSLDSCAGFDYRDSQCWTHTDQTIKYEIVNPFVTQVKVLDRCHGPTTKFFVTTTTAPFSVTRQGKSRERLTRYDIVLYVMYFYYLEYCLTFNVWIFWIVNY